MESNCIGGDGYKLFQMPNGIRVILDHNPTTQGVTTCIFVNGATRHEDADQNGIAHFLEHEFFKGTPKRPTQLDIAKEVVSRGAKNNAGTATDFTVYFIQAPAEFFEFTADIQSDMLMNPLFDAKEIETEKGVILQERAKYLDLPEVYISVLQDRVLFGADHPMGKDPVGTEELIKGYTRDDFIRFRNEWYHPSRLVLYVNANMNTGPQPFMEILEKYFGSYDGKAEIFITEQINASHFRNPEPRGDLIKKDTEQSHMSVAFPSYKRKHPKWMSSEVLACLLGGTMASRLFEEVRSKRGLAYSVQSYTDEYVEDGYMAVLAGLDSAKLQEALQVIGGILKAVRDDVTQEEVDNAKAFLKGESIRRWEMAMSKAIFYGKQALLDDSILNPADQLALIDEVTLDMVTDCAREICNPDMARFALIGPFDGYQNYLDTVVEAMK